LRRGHDPLGAGLPLRMVEFLGGVADLHLVVGREHPKATITSITKPSSPGTRSFRGRGRLILSEAEHAVRPRDSIAARLQMASSG
jgi:hypothetical protein